VSRQPCAAPSAGPFPAFGGWRYAAMPRVILLNTPLENSMAEAPGTARDARAIPDLQMDGLRERLGHREQETGGQLH
jgi:hypothetical protein